QDVLDARLEAVERAGAIAELDQLTADVTPAAAAALVPVAGAAPVPATAARLGAMFGALERRGVWRVAPRTRVRVVLGGATLDLRQAIAPAGPIELDLHVVLGSVDVIIPPGW